MSVPETGAFGLSNDGETDARIMDAREAAFNGVILDNLSVPARAVANEVINISGVVAFDCPLCIVGREVRVVLNASHLSEDRIVNVGALSGRGQTAQFNFEIPAPQAQGQTITVRLKGERNPPVGGWETDSTAGPFEIPIVTKGTAAVNEAMEWAPFAVGGGAIGVGAAHTTDRTKIGGGLVGVGAGVAAKLMVDSVDVGEIFDFPTVPVVAGAALLGAGALFLARVESISPF